MKILGENSLSSKVIGGLKILFIIIGFIDVIILSILLKVSHHMVFEGNILGNVLDFALFFMIMITGIIALFIIYQFIKIFRNLEKNIIFAEDNSQKLNSISNSFIIISVLYLAISILILVIMRSLSAEFVKVILVFTVMLTIIFIVLGIGIKILNEIYKKAIEYKKERDFII